MSAEAPARGRGLVSRVTGARGACGRGAGGLGLGGVGAGQRADPAELGPFVPEARVGPACVPLGLRLGVGWALAVALPCPGMQRTTKTVFVSFGEGDYV